MTVAGLVAGVVLLVVLGTLYAMERRERVRLGVEVERLETEIERVRGELGAGP